MDWYKAVQGSAAAPGRLRRDQTCPICRPCGRFRLVAIWQGERNGFACSVWQLARSHAEHAGALLTSQHPCESKQPRQIAGAVQLEPHPRGFGSIGHDYMASEPPSPSGHGPEPLRVSAMSNFTNTGFVQVRITVCLLILFWGLLQLVVEIGQHLHLFSGRRYVIPIAVDGKDPIKIVFDIIIFVD